MKEHKRRLVASLVVCVLAIGAAVYGIVLEQAPSSSPAPQIAQQQMISSPALAALETLVVKGRAPKTGYARAQFGDGWQDMGNCDVRNHILARDLENETFRSPTDCTVMGGTLNDPYTGKSITFTRGEKSSADVQIDHVVALSDAWQKGAQQLTFETRVTFANDPLNLLAVDGPANNTKGDSDAATWLPPSKDYRCKYVARQIAVKQKYTIWVTAAEKEAIRRVLNNCPDQVLPVTTS